MEAIYPLPPTLPAHDPASLSAVPHRIVASWPEGTFVENLVARADGGVIVAVLSEARLDHISPSGMVEPLLQLPLPCTGMVETRSGDLIVAVGEPDASPMRLWRIDPQARTGEPLVEIAGARFLNGMAAFGRNAVLVADSRLGRLYRVDLATRAVDVWLEDERPTPAPEAAFLPGANGLKIADGRVVVTSNSRALVFAVDIAPDGSPGAMTELAHRLRADDLAIGDDGALYLTTHIGHSLDRLSPDGTRVSLAGPAEGLAGSTACAFGRAPDDAHSLYVTTTGGIVGPVDGVLQPARLVRLDLSGLDPAPRGAPTLLED